MTAKRERNVMYVGLALLALSVATVCVRRAAGERQGTAGNDRERQEMARDGIQRRTPPVPRPSHATRVTPLVLDNELIARRNLFRPLRQAESLRLVAERQGTGDRGRGTRGNVAPMPPLPLTLSPLHPFTPSPPPPLPFRLVGMVDNGRASVALVEETPSGRYQAVKAGDKVADVEVVRVEATRMVVRQAGRTREIPLSQGEPQEPTSRGRGRRTRRAWNWSGG